MKKILLMLIAFLSIQQIEVSAQKNNQKNGFQRILSQMKNENGIRPDQEEGLAELQKEYKNKCIICDDIIESEDACENLTISCIDGPTKPSCKLREKSLDALCEECPESTFVFRVHKRCQWPILRYHLMNACDIASACKAGAVCCLASGVLFVVATSCAYAFM